MAKLTYKIVEHDGGWAYKVGSTFSETFRTHQEALRAAEIASSEQQIAGTTELEPPRDRQSPRLHAGRWRLTMRCYLPQ